MNPSDTTRGTIEFRCGLSGLVGHRFPHEVCSPPGRPTTVPPSDIWKWKQWVWSGLLRRGPVGWGWVRTPPRVTIPCFGVGSRVAGGGTTLGRQSPVREGVGGRGLRPVPVA